MVSCRGRHEVDFPAAQDELPLRDVEGTSERARPIKLRQALRASTCVARGSTSAAQARGGFPSNT